MAKFEKYMEMMQEKKEEPPIENLTWDVLHQVRPTRHLEDKQRFTILIMRTVHVTIDVRKGVYTLKEGKK